MLADSTLDCSSLFLKLIILLLLTVNNFLYAEETVEAENYCAILNFTWACQAYHFKLLRRKVEHD